LKALIPPLLPKKMVDASGMSMRPGTNLADVKREVDAFFKNAQYYEPQYSAANSEFLRGLQPNVTLKKTPEPAVDSAYKNRAPNLIAVLENEARQRLADIKLQTAQGGKSEEDAAKESEQIELDLMQRKIDIWKDEQQHYEEFLAKKTKSDKNYAAKHADAIDDQRHGFSEGVSTAVTEYTEKRAPSLRARTPKRSPSKPPWMMPWRSTRSCGRRLSGHDLSRPGRSLTRKSPMSSSRSRSSSTCRLRRRPPSGAS
jgi:hypothetical protein